MQTSKSTTQSKSRRSGTSHHRNSTDRFPGYQHRRLTVPESSRAHVRSDNARSRRQNTHSFIEKQWPAKFNSPKARSHLYSSHYESQRKIVYGETLSEDSVAVNDLGDDGDSDFMLEEQDLLDTLVGAYEGSIPSSEARVIRNSFSANVDHSLSGATQGAEPWAWLDDRERLSSRKRPLPRALNSVQLREALNKEASQPP